MKHCLLTIILSCFALILGAPTATAQETSGSFENSIKIGNDNRTCDGTTEGNLRYNSGKVEFCNGTNWADATSGACSPDAACTNVGDVCSGDGSGGGNPKFAGCVCYYDSNSADAGSCQPLYVTQANQSTGSDWKTSTGTDDISTDSTEDGKVNHANRGGTLSNFPAFELCENLTDGGYTDWYLPARTELDLLWRNKTAITGFVDTYYWSSTESGGNTAWRQELTFGAQNPTSYKTDNFDVRCVRRD